MAEVSDKVNNNALSFPFLGVSARVSCLPASLAIHNGHANNASDTKSHSTNQGQREASHLRCVSGVDFELRREAYSLEGKKGRRGGTVVLGLRVTHLRTVDCTSEGNRQTERGLVPLVRRSEFRDLRGSALLGCEQWGSNGGFRMVSGGIMDGFLVDRLLQRVEIFEGGRGGVSSSVRINRGGGRRGKGGRGAKARAGW